MASLATLQTRLETLDADIASGSLTVKHGETLRTARSMEEMLKARSLLVKQIADAEGARTRVHYLYQSDRGY